MVYLVSYDLNRRKDYPKLIERLKQYESYDRVLYSQWLIEDNRPVLDVANDLARFMDSDDGLLVSVFTTKVAWQNLLITDKEMQSWISAASL